MLSVIFLSKYNLILDYIFLEDLKEIKNLLLANNPNIIYSHRNNYVKILNLYNLLNTLYYE